MATTNQITFASDEHKSHYIFQMNQYANEGKGVIFALPPSSPFGDFAVDSYYAWSSTQVTAWHQHSKAPTKLSQLQRNTEIITTVHISSHLRRLHDGDIIITRASFERLEATPTATMILAYVSPVSVRLLPRGAIDFDEAKKRAYRSGTMRDEDAPTFTDCTQPGFRAIDMVTPGYGRSNMRAHEAREITDLHPGI